MTPNLDPFSRALSRRGFLATAGAAGIGLGLAACGGSDEDAPSSKSTAGERRLPRRGAAQVRHDHHRAGAEARRHLRRRRRRHAARARRHARARPRHRPALEAVRRRRAVVAREGPGRQARRGQQPGARVREGRRRAARPHHRGRVRPQEARLHEALRPRPDRPAAQGVRALHGAVGHDGAAGRRLARPQGRRREARPADARTRSPRRRRRTRSSRAARPS